LISEVKIQIWFKQRNVKLKMEYVQSLDEKLPFQ